MFSMLRVWYNVIILQYNDINDYFLLAGGRVGGEREVRLHHTVETFEHSGNIVISHDYIIVPHRKSHDYIIVSIPHCCTEKLKERKRGPWISPKTQRPACCKKTVEDKKKIDSLPKSKLKRRLRDTTANVCVHS